MGVDAPIKPPEAPAEEGLPFHPLTTLRSLWRRRGVVVIFGMLGLVIGLAASFSLGEKRYTSETLILFRPSLTAADDTGSSLETILNLVKVPTNLEQVRRTLDDDTPVPALAASFEVAALKNTDLVAIRATADTAARAAARANALRDAFLTNQARLAESKGDRQSDLVARQLDEVKSALALADQKRIDIGVKTGVIDIEKQQIRVAGLNLTGEGTSLAVSGKLALKPTEVNDLAITGRADLRVLSAFSRDWRARGSATLRSQIGGTAKSMRVSGGLDVEDGALRLRTFPQGLDGLNGRVIFNETQARSEERRGERVSSPV